MIYHDISLYYVLGDYYTVHPVTYRPFRLVAAVLPTGPKRARKFHYVLCRWQPQLLSQVTIDPPVIHPSVGIYFLWLIVVACFGHVSHVDEILP